MLQKPLPEKFLERLNKIFSLSLSREIEKTFVERPTTFRVNTLKADRQEIKEILNSRGFKIREVAWLKDAYILLNKSKRELTDLEIYGQGKIYVQSLASIIPPLILNPQPGEKVLDLTAAPGSKTSLIAALMKRKGELVANDNNKIRFFKLMHNMELLGVVENKEDAEWQFKLHMKNGWELCEKYENYFDKILIDAPCSAEARFVQGDIKTYGYWKEHKIKEMAYKQRKLLLSAWPSLKPGGTLVYSTCTFAPEENEMQVNRLLERYETEAKIEETKIEGLKKAPVVKEWRDKKINSEIINKVLRIMPTAEIEGFFVAKILKVNC